MKKILLSFSVAFFALSLAISQPYVKTWTAAGDSSSIVVNWVNDAASSYWEWISDPSGDGCYPLFNIDISAFSQNDTITPEFWATDIKMDATLVPAFDFETVKSALFVSFWANAFDGINADDVNGVRMEIVGTVGGGWPIVPFDLPLAGWNWVSLDITEVLFSGNTPDACSGVTQVKVAISNTVNYVVADGGMFKLAIQDLTFSNGLATVPTAPIDACPTGISTYEIANTAVYPNPASTSIFVKMEGTFDVQIVDMVGKVVKSQNNVNSITPVSVSELNNGVYFIKTSVGTMTKFVKQ